MKIETGTIIVGTNNQSQLLYEFGYHTENFCLVYKKGSRNSMDSVTFLLKEVRIATDKDINTYNWG